MLANGWGFLWKAHEDNFWKFWMPFDELCPEINVFIGNSRLTKQAVKTPWRREGPGWIFDEWMNFWSQFLSFFHLQAWVFETENGHSFFEVIQICRRKSLSADEIQVELNFNFDTNPPGVYPEVCSSFSEVRKRDREKVFWSNILKLIWGCESTLRGNQLFRLDMGKWKFVSGKTWKLRNWDTKIHPVTSVITKDLRTLLVTMANESVSMYY